MRWTLWRQAFFNAGRNARAYGEVVWSWRRDAGAKLAGSVPPVTVAKKPAHRGEREVSRKAIAQGMSDCLRCPVCSCAPFLRTLAHETAGAARTRHSLRPLFERANEIAKLGRNHAAGSRGRIRHPEVHRKSAHLRMTGRDRRGRTLRLHLVSPLERSNPLIPCAFRHSFHIAGNKFDFVEI